MAKSVIVQIEGLAPYCQSRFHGEAKLNKEASDAYEARTWREKAHWDDDGNMVIPMLAFKNAVAEIAKYLGEQIPGKGKSTYTKHFEAGVMCVEDFPIFYKGNRVNKAEVIGDTKHVPADGKRGGGTRVLRTFPTVPRGWTTTATFLIVDDVITRQVFEYHLRQAGQLIGIGSFRIRNNGTMGRFKPLSFEWSEGLIEV